MTGMRRSALLLLPLLLACKSSLPDKIELTPEAEQVEFAYETPSAEAYKMVGQVEGVAAANDEEQATLAAKNDLRNKAAALGAVIVEIVSDTGSPMPLESKTKVKVVGRAYKPVD
jgi:hypothetical protein